MTSTKRTLYISTHYSCLKSNMQGKTNQLINRHSAILIIYPCNNSKWDLNQSPLLKRWNYILSLQNPNIICKCDSAFVVKQTETAAKQWW